MKKISRLVVIVLVIALLQGCGTDSYEIGVDQRDTNPLKSSIINLCVTPVSADNMYQSTIVDVMTETVEYEEIDYLECAEEYISSCDDMESFSVNYHNCDYVEAYPLLGTYLENTGMVAYLFYKDEEPVGIATLTIDPAGNVISASDYKDMTKTPEYVVALSIEECYMVIVDCLVQYPTFEIVGIVLDTEGYPAVYPIGKFEGDSTLKYVHGDPREFSLVEPFTSVEEGRAAFALYMREKEKILSEITLYPWVSTEFYELGYLREFMNTEKYFMEKENGNFSYLDEYDSVIAVPLLSEELQENIYILHMLYYHNQLIAELIIQRKPDGSSITYLPVWENVAEKNEEGSYISINKSMYTSALGSVMSFDSSWENQGVVFQGGQLCPVGLSNGALMTYREDMQIASIIGSQEVEG